MFKSGDVVIMDKPTVHLWWVIKELLYAIGTDRIVAAYVVALDANTQPIPEFWEIVPLSKLTLDKKRRL